MTQKFKGSYVELSQVVENVKQFYNAADTRAWNTGMAWYENAYLAAMEMGLGHGASIEQACGIIAAFSPQCDWDLNLQYAEQFLKTGTTGRTGAQLSKAREVLKLETAQDIRAALSTTDDGAPKVKAFFDCIYDPWCDSVVIDRHAIACGLQQPASVGVLAVNMQSITLAQYNFLARAYTKVADMVGIRPNQMQAICWESYRALRKLRHHKMQAA